MTIPEFWQAIRAKESELAAVYGEGGCLYTTPTHDQRFNTAGGDAVEVTIPIAARGIVEGKCVVSTEAEIALYREHARLGKMVADAQTLKTGGLSKMILSTQTGQRP